MLTFLTSTAHTNDQKTLDFVVIGQFSDNNWVLKHELNDLGELLDCRHDVT